MTPPAVAILPYGTRLGAGIGRVDLDALHWPLGRPRRLVSGCVADLRRDDHLIVYPKTNMHFLPRLGSRARISVMVVEPAAIHRRHLMMLRLTWRRFFRVLTYNEPLLNAVPNALLLPYGTTWVPEYASRDLTKTQHMSLIASAKRDQEGHRLRHRVVAFARSSGVDVDVVGRGYVPFGDKAEGLAPYRFSVVIENAREKNYFSEKLIDALLCETVPIYWGCPNIEDFIDPAGLIRCATEEELQQAIKTASEAQYRAMLPGLRKAKRDAIDWIDVEKRAAEAVVASV